MMFGKKNKPQPEDHGPHSIHPKSKLPPKIAMDKPEVAVAQPQPAKPVLTPAEMEQLREAKFRQLKIPYAKVLEAEKTLAAVNPQIKRFDPDLIEKDFLTINHRLESYCFGFQLSAYDFFVCLLIILRMTEQQAKLVNSISEGIVHTELIINLIVWRHLEQKLRKEKNLAPTDHLPESEIIAASRSFWQNADRIIVWKQAERRLRHQRNLPSEAVIAKEDIEKMYQELMLQRQQHQQTTSTQIKPSS